MRKRVIAKDSLVEPARAGQDWLDLEDLALVEISSEDPAHPIESALVPGAVGGWRAANPGEQSIRLLFDRPLGIRRIRLLFREEERHRTQEFALRCSVDGGRSYREILRQQYNFSPPGTSLEAEEYRVALDGVTTLELTITPDIGGAALPASLEELRIA